ncbi:MAG TPA: hypothetical protein VLB84_01500, partial [Bacteroidia bacterium]|nr:hypothetical protein [Bacteroidia bacterium]
YSIVLVLSVLSVFALAVTDALGQTEGGVETLFNTVQAPLEAAISGYRIHSPNYPTLKNQSCINYSLLKSKTGYSGGIHCSLPPTREYG